MSKLHVNHLKAKLTEKYASKIDITDARNDEEKENFFLTRAYAAYTLQVLALLDETAAAATITDGLMTMESMLYSSIDEIKNCGSYNQSGLKVGPANPKQEKPQNSKLVCLTLLI